MTHLVFLAIAVFGPAVAVSVRADRRGRRLPAIAALGILAAAGDVVCGFGLLVLVFNGYVEDNGSTPAHTLGLAIPLLLLGAAMLVGAWLASGRR